MVVRATEALGKLPAYVAHAHFLFFPLLRDALVDGDATVGIYAGLHLRKPVVASLDFRITPTAGLHVCADDQRLICCAPRFTAVAPPDPD